MAAVNTADTTGGEEANPGHRGRSHRRRHGGRSDVPARQGRTEITRAHLDRARGNAHQLAVGEADADPPVEHRDSGRHPALVSYRGLALARGTQVVGSGESLADDRGLEGDHRPAFRQRLGDLCGNLEQVAQLGRAPARVTAPDATTTARSAASSGVAPSRYDTQKAAARASPAPLGSTSRTCGARTWWPETWQPSAPSLRTATLARSSMRTPRDSDSAAVPNSRSGRRRTSSSAKRAAPYSLSPATDDRSIDTRPFRFRTRSMAAFVAAASGSVKSE